MLLHFVGVKGAAGRLNPRCAKSVPRQANAARQSLDRVDTNQPLNWAFQDAMAPCETRSTVGLGFKHQRSVVRRNRSSGSTHHFSPRRPRYSAVPNSVGAVSRAASDNPLALGLILVGAVALAISTFLPLVEPTGTFRMVEHNTLIQRGGWLLIALALGIAASGYRVSQGRWAARWVPIALCVSAAALIVLNDKDLRTLYPVGPDGNPITTQPGIVANPGIAIYVAGAGVAAAFIGSVILLRSRQAKTKKCPDCAETVLADANVCKHCGYRFASSSRR